MKLGLGFSSNRGLGLLPYSSGFPAVLRVSRSRSVGPVVPGKGSCLGL